MRIAIQHLEYNRRGGIERIAAELADHLVKFGHEVDFYCARVLDDSSSSVKFRNVFTLNSVNSLRLLSFSFFGHLSLSRNKYDVSHSFGSVVGCDVITAQSCHAAGIETARLFFKNRIQNTRNFGIADRIRIILERQNFGKKNFKKIIACSSLVKRELMKYYDVPENNIVVILNGVDTEVFHPRNKEIFRQEIRSRLGIKDKEVVLLFVGNEFVRKGLETVIRCLPFLDTNNVRLVVCGNDVFTPFEILARSCRVAAQVLFVGPQTEIHKYYAASDIFVLPSFHEAFGLVITEAMASGLPVVVSRNAGASEDIIEDGVNGLLVNNPLDPKELADKLNHLTNDPIFRTKIAHEAYKRVQGFTWNTYTHEVIQVYQGINPMIGLHHLV